MLEVKPAPGMFVGHPDVTGSNPGGVEELMVTSGGFNQAEVLNRLNGNYRSFSHVKGGRGAMARGASSRFDNTCRNSCQHQDQDFGCPVESPINTMMTWPSSPSTASSPSSSLSSLSSSSSSVASPSSTLSSSEIDVDKENNVDTASTGRAYNPRHVRTLDAAVIDPEISHQNISDRDLSPSNNNNNVFSLTSICDRHSNRCTASDFPHAFSRNPYREENTATPLSPDAASRPARRAGLRDYDAWRLNSTGNTLTNSFMGTRVSPTTSARTTPYGGDTVGVDSGLISPTSKAIADSLSERRACQDFAKYLISPSSASASPSSRSPCTPSSQPSGASPASPAAGSLYRGLPFSRSASALSTRPLETPSPGHTSCSSTPTEASRLRAMVGNAHHLRRQQHRDRKFRLNLFMYGALYRKQRRADTTGYIIYHNPIEGNHFRIYYLS